MHFFILIDSARLLAPYCNRWCQITCSATNGSTHFLTFLANLNILLLKFFWQSEELTKTYFALICVFPSNNEGQHFIGHVDFLLLEWPFPTSFSFFSWAFICLFFIIYRNSLYTWHIFPFTIVWFANIFLVNDLCFSLFMVTFAIEVLQINSRMSVFYFVTLASISHQIYSFFYLNLLHFFFKFLLIFPLFHFYIKVSNPFGT